MGKLIKKIKIKKQDGTFTDYIPIGAEARNIDTDDGDSVQLKLNKKPYYYNTVADMKADSKLRAGDTVITLGYYEVNDGGGAKYRITDTEIQTEHQEEIINLYATLIAKNKINVKQLGAYGDAIHDDTLIIQKSLDLYNQVLIPDGTYIIDSNFSGTNGLVLNNNNHLILSKNTVLKSKPIDNTHYRIIMCNNVNNITIEGGTIQGEREEHIGTTGEYGVGIYVLNSTNITIKDTKIKDTWGDGITINGGENVRTQNLYIYNARRNGITIGNAKNYHSVNDTIENTNGTSPEAGVDIEGSYTTSKYQNIVFDNLTTLNNNGNGITINALNCDDTSEDINIVINNHYDKGGSRGFSVRKSKDSKGRIINNKPYYINSQISGISFTRCYDSELSILIIQPKIINCNTSLNTTRKYAAGITMYLEDNEEQLPQGNVEIIEPYVTNASETLTSTLYFQGIGDGYINNLKLINPLNCQYKQGLYARDCKNFVFEDKYKEYVAKISSSQSTSLTRYSEYIYEDNAANRTLTLGDTSYQIGDIITITNLSEYLVYVKFPTTDYLKTLSNSVSPRITLGNYGASVTLKKYDSTNWILLNSIGNITV